MSTEMERSPRGIVKLKLEKTIFVFAGIMYNMLLARDIIN